MNLFQYLAIALLPLLQLYIPIMDIQVKIIAVSGDWARPSMGNDAWTLAAIGDQVGWLDPAGGPQQSGPGNIVLVGHYSLSPDGTPGAFHDLEKLAYGDFIYARRPDGSTVGYRVIQVSLVDDQDMSVVWDTGDQRLTLIGCPGTDYSHRRVVVAENLGTVICMEQPGGDVVPCF